MIICKASWSQLNYETLLLTNGLTAPNTFPFSNIIVASGQMTGWIVPNKLMKQTRAAVLLLLCCVFVILCVMDAHSPEWKCPGSSWISPASGISESEWLEALMWPSWVTHSPCLTLFVFSRTRICGDAALKSLEKKIKVAFDLLFPWYYIPDLS